MLLLICDGDESCLRLVWEADHTLGFTEEEWSLILRKFIYIYIYTYIGAKQFYVVITVYSVKCLLPL